MPADGRDPGPNDPPEIEGIGASTSAGGNAATPAKKVAKIMVYTHPKVARKIKQIALDNERKANDVILDALDIYFAKHGHVGLRHVIESKG